jgi:hypothetical protein
MPVRTWPRIICPLTSANSQTELSSVRRGLLTSNHFLWNCRRSLCHPERSRGICGLFILETPPGVLKQKCHPDRSVAQWRDLLFYTQHSQTELLSGKRAPFMRNHFL